jgi:hypothetical protein
VVVVASFHMKSFNIHYPFSASNKQNWYMPKTIPSYVLRKNINYIITISTPSPPDSSEPLH